MQMLMTILIPLTPIILLFIIYFIYRFFYKMKKDRNPFKDKLSRSPGETTLKKCEEITDNILINVVFFVVFPLAFYSTHLTSVYYFKMKDSYQSNIINITIVSIFLLYFGYSIVKNLNLRRKYRLGLDGELYVGQELNQLMLQGYRVFHDFPADGFNIDHVLVGPSGIYAMETKARRKPRTKNPSHDAKVRFDGRALSFPNWTETQPVDQAIRQAKWLANWLSKAVGQNVSVRAMLALPGWYVERTSPNGIWVGNPKMLKHLFLKRKEQILSDSQIQAICHQLNQKCQDVEPQVGVYYDKK